MHVPSPPDQFHRSTRSPARVRRRGPASLSNLNRVTSPLPWLTDEADRLVVVGVLNVTPDSFSDGGRYHDLDAALAHGVEMARDGADLVDVGGESTRPGADRVNAATEVARVLPVIRGLAVGRRTDEH